MGIGRQLEETYVVRRKTAELQETYGYYSGTATQSEEFFWQDDYQSHYTPRFGMTLELTSYYHHHLIGKTDKALVELKKQEDDLEDTLVDLLRKEAQDEH